MSAQPLPIALPASTASAIDRVAVPRQSPALSLHIDRIVIDGMAFGLRDRARLQAALEAELGTLFTARGVGDALRGGGALPGLRVDAMQLAAGVDASDMGRAIARALHREMTR